MFAVNQVVAQIVKEAIRRDELGDQVAVAYAVFVEVGIELSLLFADMRFEERKAKE